MKLRQLLSLLFAVTLQVLPVCRMAVATSAANPTGYAVLLRCVIGLAALLGSVHAVSGASATISGVVKYPFSPLNPITTNATGRTGAAFNYRIIVTGGLQDTNFNYYNASPLPPGLTIDTNLGASGFISGTPTVAGVTFPIRLTAGNKLYDDLGGAPVHLDIMITLTNASGGSPPSISMQPQSRTVTIGGAASFTVVATGSPAPTYQWRKTGANLADATMASYTIPTVTTNHAGDYTVVASNTSGSVTSLMATLTVLVPPSITAQPQNQTALTGGSATFTVTATGTAPLGYQWRKGAADLAGETGATLARNHLTVVDAGDYFVTVTNSAGSAVSEPATLRLVGPPTIGSPALDAGAIRFSFTQEPGPTYTVLHSWAVSGEAWLTLSNLPPTAASVMVTIADALTPTNRFYRIRLTQP